MVRSFIATALLVLLVGLTTAPAEAAEQTLKFRLVTYALNVTAIPASNTEGHILGVGKFRGVAVFEDGGLADKLFTVSFDYTEGVGPFHGYSTYIFEDGSTIGARFDGTSEVGKNGRVIRGEYSVLTGTSRYEGVKGSGSFVSKPVPWEEGAVLYDGEFKLTIP